MLKEGQSCRHGQLARLASSSIGGGVGGGGAGGDGQRLNCLTMSSTTNLTRCGVVAAAAVAAAFGHAAAVVPVAAADLALAIESDLQPEPSNQVPDSKPPMKMPPAGPFYTATKPSSASTAPTTTRQLS